MFCISQNIKSNEFNKKAIKTIKSVKKIQKERINNNLI